METGPPHAKHQEMTSCLMKEVQTHAVVSGSGNHHPINEGVEEGRFGADRERLWLQRPQKQAAGTTHRSGGWWRSFGGWKKLDGWNEAQAQWSPVAEGAEGQGVSSAPIPPSRKLLPGLSSPPVTILSQCRQSFVRSHVVCAPIRPVSAVDRINVSVRSTTGFLLQIEWSAFRICGPAAPANAGGE